MRRSLTLLLWTAATLCGSFSARAYELTGSAWANGNIVMQLQLGSPSSALSDGSTTWGRPAQTALATWNNYITRSKFTFVDPSTVTKANDPNSYNNVYFAATVGGEDFDDGVLAITRRWVVRTSSGAYRISEADVVFNSADYTWDSYRGARRQRPDFQRVAIHEFGHALGLDHPDEADPPQSVTAIMNSRVSDIDTVQADDIAGARFLYDVQGQPAVTQHPSSTVVAAGEPFSLTYAASGSPITYGWLYSRSNDTPTDDLLDGDGNPWNGATYSVASADPADAGYYRGFAANAIGSATTNTAQVVVQTPTGMELAYLANISTRGYVGTGDNILIAGFVITGSTSKPVLIRGIGPTLASQGVSGPLADPKITLMRSGTAIASNDNWGGGAALSTAFSRTGAFSLPSSSKDAAMLVTLDPGPYTVLVEGVGSTTGVALVEVYDADETAAQSLTHKLINISTRGYVGTGDEILIAGFVINGPAPKRVLLRAGGPALTSQGVPGVNTDPNLRLFRGSTQIADNDDWAYSNQTDVLPGLFDQVGAFRYSSGSYDSAMVITLKPGPYTVLIEGRNDETGIALVEVYELP